MTACISKGDQNGLIRNGKRKRDNLEIFGDILEASTEGMTKTNIMCRCNLSYEQIIFSLKELQTKNLISCLDGEGRVHYVTTELGRDFLNSYRMMMALMDDASLVPTRYLSHEVPS